MLIMKYPVAMPSSGSTGRGIGSSISARRTGPMSTGSPLIRPPCVRAIGSSLARRSCCFNLANDGTFPDLTARVDLLTRSRPEDRSAILKSIPSGEGSRVLQAPDAAAGWLRDRLMNLSVMYRATQAITNVLDIDTLSPQILELVFESIGADRGAILLKDESGQLVPKAVRWRNAAQPDERMTISQTIIDYVLNNVRGSLQPMRRPTQRFGPAQSIVDFQIREAICVPIQGRHTTLGVLYADVQADVAAVSMVGGKPTPRGRFSQDQLMLMVAIGHQAGLAIENTQFYNDKIQAERLAAVGQTIATLSHHIKNILQGIRGGSYLDRPGPQGKRRIHRPARLDDRRQEPNQDL